MILLGFLAFFIFLCFSELKVQLQSSFEVEDSSLEEQYAGPDTPVALVPDQLVAPANTQQTTPTPEDPLTISQDYPADLVLNTNCPLSKQLRELRLETIG